MTSPSPTPSNGPSRLTFPRSAGLKLILVCFLVLLMGIPAMFIGAISYERSTTADQVVRDVSARYGGPQTLIGPILLVPYSATDAKSGEVERGQYVLYPDTGVAALDDVSVDVKTQSLYRIPVYTAKGTLSATFDDPLAALATAGFDLDLDAARLLVSVSDVRGLKQDMALRGPNGDTRLFEPTDIGQTQRYVPAVMDKAGSVVRSAVPAQSYSLPNIGTWLAVDAGDWLTEGRALNVSTALLLDGAETLSIAPFARSTAVTMTSSWADPGFQGEFTPLSKSITDAGFTADWNMPYLSRGIRAQGKAQNVLDGLAANLVRVKFVNTDSPYQTVNRALKYSILFIGMVFLAYFLFEVIVGVPVHPAQYILIGLAQAIFYLLLLAFAERIGFTPAFAVASVLTVMATAGYAGAVFGGRGYIVKAGLVFALVYGLLFILMQVEDFALMIGALASFIAIAATMYLTRNMDWYGGQKS